MCKATERSSYWKFCSSQFKFHGKYVIKVNVQDFYDRSANFTESYYVKLKGLKLDLIPKA